MEEAANADYVIIIDDGQIAAKGTPAELREKYSSDRLYLSCSDRESVQNILTQKGVPFDVVADRAIVQIQSSLDALPILRDCGDYITGFEVINGTMDDAFIAITGKEIRE